MQRAVVYLVVVFGLMASYLIYQQGVDVSEGIVPVIFLLAILAFFVVLLIALRGPLQILVYLLRSRIATNRGNFERAEAHLNKAMARAEATGRNRDKFIGPVYALLADLRRVQGRYAESESIFKQAIANFTRLGKSRTTNVANAACNLAVVYIHQGRFAEAEPLCREALAIFERAKHVGTPVVMLNLGQALAGLGNRDRAEELTRQSLKLAEKQGKRGRYAQCVSLANLADLYSEQGRLSEAGTLAHRGLDYHSKVFPASEAFMRLRLLNALAEVLRKQGHLPEAEALCEQAQQLVEKNKGGEYFNMERCLTTLARIRVAQNRPAEAEAMFRRCLEILQESAPEHPERAKRLTECAAVLRRLDRPDEAEQMEAEAKAIPVVVLRA
jgi:tetratricopeptide (TPR) repeat protein